MTDDTVSQLKRELKFAWGEKARSNRRLAAMDAIITAAIERAREKSCHLPEGDSEARAEAFLDALDYIERQSARIARVSYLGVEHFIGEATPLDELIEWLG